MRELDETLQIDTPENITFGYEVAGIGSRFLAALIDTFLILILQVIANLLVFLVLFRGNDNLETILEGSSDSAAGWVIALAGLIAFFFLWGYYIFFEMLWNGQSPGKALFHLRVIRADGTPITLTESFIRNLVRLVDFLPAYYGIGVVTMFVSDQSRRLGDLAANTLVVREESQKVTLQNMAASVRAAPPPVTATASGTGSVLQDGSLPVERLNEEDIQVAESFLARRLQLSNRRELSLRVARMLMTRMALDPGSLSPEQSDAMIISIVNRYRGREMRKTNGNSH